MTYKKITYVFGFGRKNKLNDENYSDEFFYGYKDFLDFGFDAKMIEFENCENPKLLFLDKFIRKFLKLPSYTNNLTSKENYKILEESDVVVFSMERAYLGSYLMYRKIAKKNISQKTAMFVMGFFSKLSKKPILFYIQKKLLLKVFKKLDFLIFLGRGEMVGAKKIFPELAHKFNFLPFEINKKFWEINDKPQLKKRSGILFIGNDGNREYEKVIKIAERIQNVEFTFITEQIDRKNIKTENITLINGHWNKNVLTDKEMIKYYDNAILTIIPLTESLQPSGQSVTLQSMARGVPVMITKTKGFWDYSNYKNLENIIFIDDDSVENWVLNINNYLENYETINTLSKNSLHTFAELNNDQNFYRTIKKLTGIN
jgi:glycosyltransferase involved in cell wall biosynthesis